MTGSSACWTGYGIVAVASSAFTTPDHDNRQFPRRENTRSYCPAR